MDHTKKDNTSLRAGAAVVEVQIPAQCFPIDGFTSLDGGLFTRVVLLENSIDGERFAIMSMDVTNIYRSAPEELKEILLQEAGVKPENAWITVTHNFTTPHLWETPPEGQPDVERPGHKPRSEEELRRCRLFNAAFFTAAKQAAAEAAASLRPAIAGSGAGYCTVNASRNMETADGWWLGCSAAEYSDHTVPMLKLEEPDGTPIALIYAYDCQSTVMSRAADESGNLIMTGDLLGRASRYVERAIPYVALGLCGACGDQEPQLKACSTQLDAEGHMVTVNLGHAGMALLRAQGDRLGSEILRRAKQIDCRAPERPVRAGRVMVTCDTKVSEKNLKLLHPTRSYTYVPKDQMEVPCEAMIVGNAALIGTRAELSGRIGTMIREGAAGALCAGTAQNSGAAADSETAQDTSASTAIVANLVNGAAKYMVDEASYDRFMYGAMNSFFMKGSAEKLAAAAVALVGNLAK